MTSTIMRFLTDLLSRGCLAAALVVGIAASSSVYAEAENAGPLSADRTTLETIGLQSLDSAALEGAVIGDSLDAPVAGESLEVPRELKEQKSDGLGQIDTKEDFGRTNVPAAFNVQPEGYSVGGRTYFNNYQFTTITR